MQVKGYHVLLPLLLMLLEKGFNTSIVMITMSSLEKLVICNKAKLKIHIPPVPRYFFYTKHVLAQLKNEQHFKYLNLIYTCEFHVIYRTWKKFNMKQWYTMYMVNKIYSLSNISVIYVSVKACSDNFFALLIVITPQMCITPR